MREISDEPADERARAEAGREDEGERKAVLVVAPGFELEPDELAERGGEVSPAETARDELALRGEVDDAPGAIGEDGLIGGGAAVALAEDDLALGAEALRRDGALGGRERMRGRASREQEERADGHALERRGRHQRSGDADVGVAAEDALADGAERVGDDAELEAGERVFHRVRERHEGARREEGVDAHGELVALAAAQRSGGVAHAVHFAEHAPGVAEEAAAALGEPDRALGAVPELEADRVFEGRHGLAHGGLHASDPARRGGEAPGVRDGGEHAEVIERHAVERLGELLFRRGHCWKRSMHPHRTVDERAFADTEEVPVVADPDLCDDEPMPETLDELPETVPDGSIFRRLAASRRRGDLVVE